MHFWVKSLKSKLFQIGRRRKNLNTLPTSSGYHAYRFDDSRIDIVGVEGYRLPGRTDGWTDEWTVGRQTVTQNPLFFFKKSGENDGSDSLPGTFPFHSIYLNQCIRFISLNLGRAQTSLKTCYYYYMYLLKYFQNTNIKYALTILGTILH